MSPVSRSDKLHALVLAAIALVSACLMCVAVVGLVQLWPPPLLAEHGYLTRLCVTAKLGNQSRVASWVSPAISARTGHIRYPAIQGSSICGFAPWAPRLPANATWEVEQ
jgi:hypothetical protein